MQPILKGKAKDYCRALGLDPNEPVYGYNQPMFGPGVRMRVHMPRWQWYLGADCGDLPYYRHDREGVARGGPKPSPSYNFGSTGLTLHTGDKRDD